MRAPFPPRVAALQVSFTAADLAPGYGSITGLVWQINGRAVSTQGAFKFGLGRGTHNITLQVTNSAGRTTTVSASINETSLNHPQLNHQMVVTSGELAEESGELLRSFFRERRT